MGKVITKKQKLNDGKVHKNASAAVSHPEPESESDSGSESGTDSNAEDSESESEVESQSESESEASSEEESDSDIPKKKKSKSTDDNSASFSTAMSAILGSKLKKHDRDDPILVRSRKIVKKFEEDKLENKARRLINMERKARLNSNRVRDLLPKDDTTARSILAREKQYKKTAQRGVIKLFNAVLLSQQSSQKAVSSGDDKLIGATKKQELINELSKEKFMDLVQNAAK